ncbi:hypothetical protein EVAR_98014_1 [Eumeta japonica]|uniref:Sodium channel protein Nach n=1 Tax=Eumeta variegata TaxID=151549 RepID=A0A4C1WK17_EUMVA|nr:hypothetical protein EVAR_98014_1 [Eumeta japonica]
MFRQVLTHRGYCCRFDITFFKSRSQNLNYVSGHEQHKAFRVVVDGVKVNPNGSTYDGNVEIFVFNSENGMTMLDSALPVRPRTQVDVTVDVWVIDTSDQVKALAKETRKCILDTVRWQTGDELLQGVRLQRLLRGHAEQVPMHTVLLSMYHIFFILIVIRCLDLKPPALAHTCWGLPTTAIIIAMTTSGSSGLTCSPRHTAIGLMSLKLPTHWSIRPWSGPNPALFGFKKTLLIIGPQPPYLNMHLNNSTHRKEYSNCTWEKYYCAHETFDSFIGSSDAMATKYSCYPSCDSFEYMTQAQYTLINVPRYGIRRWPFVNLSKLNSKNDSTVLIHFGDTTCVKYRRELLFTWDQMLASLGGIFGLSVGGSIISIIELLYFMLDLTFTTARLLAARARTTDERTDNQRTIIYTVHPKQTGSGKRPDKRTEDRHFRVEWRGPRRGCRNIFDSLRVPTTLQDFKEELSSEYAMYLFYYAKIVRYTKLLWFFEDDDDVEPQQVFIEPSGPTVLYDEDSADEDQSGFINNLSGRQLGARCEVMLAGKSKDRVRRLKAITSKTVKSSSEPQSGPSGNQTSRNRGRGLSQCKSGGRRGGRSHDPDSDSTTGVTKNRRSQNQGSRSRGRGLSQRGGGVHFGRRPRGRDFESTTNRIANRTSDHSTDSSSNESDRDSSEKQPSKKPKTRTWIHEDLSIELPLFPEGNYSSFREKTSLEMVEQSQ